MLACMCMSVCVSVCVWVCVCVCVGGKSGPFVDVVCVRVRFASARYNLYTRQQDINDVKLAFCFLSWAPVEQQKRRPATIIPYNVSTHLRWHWLECTPANMFQSTKGLVSLKSSLSTLAWSLPCEGCTHRTLQGHTQTVSRLFGTMRTFLFRMSRWMPL